MKRILLFYILVFLLNISSIAQNYNINFEKINDWTSIVQKAQKTKRLIFVDCYTSTCPPCRYVAKNIFTLDSVANFFNTNFINVKIDIRNDEVGSLIKTNYQVTAFPTFLFIDPNTEKIVHRMVGNNGIKSFMKGARLASDGRNNLTGMIKRYAAGERKPEFIKEYIRLLSAAYMLKELAPILPDYFNELPDNEFFTKENWNLYKQNISNPLAASSKRFLKNIDKMDSLVPSQKIKDKMFRDLKELTIQLSYKNNNYYNEDLNDELIEYLSTLNLDGVSTLLANLYTAEYLRRGDFRGMVNKMYEALSYNFFNERDRNIYVSHFLGSLKLCYDKILLQEVYGWLENYSKGNNDCFFLASILPVKIILLENLGDKVGALKIKKLQEENQEKVYLVLEKRLGTKLTRRK